MPDFVRSVSPKATSREVLPDWLNLYVVMLEWLRVHGVVKEVGERLLIYRQGGYTGEDVFMFMLGMFCSGFKRGIKHFHERSRPYGKKLAALAGREEWPHQSSMSRALKCVSEQILPEFLRWLLIELPALESRQSGRFETHVCRQGDDWHVFHWDAKVKACRVRGLRRGEDLPEPVRLDERIAAPGYPGRKRGQRQLSVSKVQHCGSGQWLTVDVQPGNGSLKRQQQDAYSAVKHWATLSGVPTERCILISDGVGGGSVQMRTGLQSPILFLTRMANYSLLTTEAIASDLERMSWEEVPSSGSGPRRVAAELGFWSDSHESSVRYVVSRFAVAEDAPAHGAGTVIANWQYELFATTVDAMAFSASDIVSLYYGRCGMENQFACENRELGLNHLFARNPAGHALATGIAMFVWNMKMQLGVEMVQLKGEFPDEDDRHTNANEQPHPDDNTPQEEKAPPLSAPEPIVLQWNKHIPVGTLQIEALSAQTMQRYLDRHDGFTWNMEQPGLTCPKGQVLRACRALEMPGGKLRIRFRGLKTHCFRCPQRPQCTTSTLPSFRKDIDICLSSDETRLLKLHSGIASDSTVEPAPTFTRATNALQRQLSEKQVQLPTLLPAEIRKLVDRECWDITAKVNIISPATTTAPGTPYLATTRFARQRSRKTWTEKRAWNALAESAQVHTIMTGSAAMRLLLKPRNEAAKQRNAL